MLQRDSSGRFLAGPKPVAPSARAVDFSLEFPQRDVARLMSAMNKAAMLLNKDARDVIAWAGAMVSRSLSASTRIAPKLRPIVKNPNADAGRDLRRAAYGMEAYRKGKKVFVPLAGTQFIRRFQGVIVDVVIRYRDKKTSQIIDWNRNTGERRVWRGMPEGDEMSARTVMNDPRRVIRRRGLAQKAWRGLVKFTRRGGRVAVGDVGRAAVARWAGGKANPELHLDNALKYAGAAFRTGDDWPVDGAVQRAARAMEHEINRRVAAKMGLK